MDYLPRKSAELVAWSANFAEQVSLNAGRWEIPGNEVSDLQTATANFSALHAKADSPMRTPVVIAQKDEACDLLCSRIRAMVSFRLQNPVITNDQRIALGLHIHDKRPTSLPMPTKRPLISARVVDVRRVAIDFQDQDSPKSKAKPYGVIGGVIRFAVLDTPPADPDVLSRSVLATRTPHVFEFTEEERGRTVYFVICWENEKGQQGPWSEIISAIIP
ncbi:MAG: hypothetical protein LBM08_15540 [Dysgonamonadaceae bacterium]|jgi:hypothetical protein|nr:hypothetical protein [Dysgonamonadaceae bacterium]